MKIVRSEDLTGFVGLLGDQPHADAIAVIDFSDDPAVLRKLWGLVLLVAIEDSATSVHYHPWRADGGLAYIVTNVRYLMVPPPVHLAGPMIAAARSLIEPPWGLIARFAAGRQGTVSGSFTFDVGGDPFEWDVVCWSVGLRSGAEFFRVTPPLDASPA